jgi:membrane protease YdiL (CAAX protease family)
MKSVRYSVLLYFALTFAISWGGVLWVVAPHGIPGSTDDFAGLIIAVVIAMLAGPSVGGLLATALVHGRAGLRELRSGLVKWRVGARWYAIAILTAPLLVAAILVALLQTSPVYRPGIVATSDPASHLLFGIAVGIGAGVFEELGWTGFAVPMMRRRHGILATGLIVGLVWGAWHFLASWWGSGPTSGGLSMAIYMPVMLFSFLPPYRVLMVWVYHRTGSLLVAMLMHASLTGGLRILDPLAISGPPLLIYNLILAAVLWVAVAVVLATGRGKESAVSR